MPLPAFNMGNWAYGCVGMAIACGYMLGYICAAITTVSGLGVPQIGQLDLLAYTTFSLWFLQDGFAQCQSPGRTPCCVGIIAMPPAQPPGIWTNCCGCGDGIGTLRRGAIGAAGFSVPQMGQADLLPYTTFSVWFLQSTFGQCQSPARAGATPPLPPGAPPKPPPAVLTIGALSLGTAEPFAFRGGRAAPHREHCDLLPYTVFW
mmetsp:Transcript_19795/g.57590  ORF Transcript_19795/g.57590 Transcript_19795/m.57590 type:complete len:204 (-) Transcript_19795:200-811(-)